MDLRPEPAEDDDMSDRTASLGWRARSGHRRPVVAATVLAALLLGGCGPPDRPDPLSEPAVTARAETMERMHDGLDEVVAILDGQVLGESSVDECYEGQRNWKVDLGYDHRCSLLIGVLIGVDGDFRTLMLAVDVDLQERQWRSPDGGWPGQLVDAYWELRASENPDGRVRLDRLPGPHSVHRDDLGLRFAYGSTDDDRGLERIDRSQRSTLWCCGPPYYEQRALMDVARAVEGADQPHLVLLTIEGHYLQR
jgi:hypothetical protein